MALLEIAENFYSVLCVKMSGLHWVPPHMKWHLEEKPMIAPALGSWGRLSNCSLPDEGMQHTHFCITAESQMSTFLSQATYDTATKPHILVFFSHHSQAKLLPYILLWTIIATLLFPCPQLFHCQPLPFSQTYPRSPLEFLLPCRGALTNSSVASASWLTTSLPLLQRCCPLRTWFPLQIVQEKHTPQGQETFLFISSFIP